MVRTRFAFLLLSSLAALAANAQPGGFGIQIPAGGGPMPNYWSGTNCRASGGAQIGEPIYAAQLLLNGELVYDWVAPDPETYPLSIALKVMFDSSHFGNGTPVEVTLKVWGVFTGMQEGSSNPDPIVKNRLMMFEHDDPGLTPDAAPLVNDLMTGKNYGLLLRTLGPWMADNYWGALNGGTNGNTSAVFYAGHGGPGNHDACIPPDMTPADYETHRTSDIGTGLPPFNSTGRPPVFFIHLAACECGKTSNFKTALWPYYMGWGGPYLEDQALLGYREGVYLGEYSGLATMIWEDLVVGKTAGKAVDEFNTFLTTFPGVFHSIDLIGERDMVPADVALYGDATMRLKTVYTGSHAPPTRWYIPL